MLILKCTKISMVYKFYSLHYLEDCSLLYVGCETFLILKDLTVYLNEYSWPNDPTYVTMMFMSLTYLL